MNIENEKNLKLLNSIFNSYKPSYVDYENIAKSSSKILMSKTKNASLFGMFYPYPEIQEKFIYKGKLVKDSTKCDFTYYFDNVDRLLLTKRKFPQSHLALIFYYHYDSYVDFVWYLPDKNKIETVGRMEKLDGKPYRFLESMIIKKEVEAYIEYVFTSENKIIQKQFARGILPGGKDHESVTSFSKVDGA